MLRDAAVDLLMLRLGNRTDTALRNIIISEMEFVQTTVLEATFPLPWFLLKKDATLVTVVGDETVAAPADFLAEWEDGGLARIDGDGKEVKMVREDYAIIRDQKDGSGTPDYYDLINKVYYLRYVPSTIITLVPWYFGKAATLAGVYGTNNVENAWLADAADLLIAETGTLLAVNHLQSPKMAASFLGQAQQARGRLDTRITAMEESNKQRFMEG